MRGWDRRNAYYFHRIRSLGQTLRLRRRHAVAGAGRTRADAVLFGSGSETIAFSYVSGRRQRHQRKHKFEGIVPNLERRYRETEIRPRCARAG